MDIFLIIFSLPFILHELKMFHKKRSPAGSFSSEHHLGGVVPLRQPPSHRHTNTKLCVFITSQIKVLAPRRIIFTIQAQLCSITASLVELHQHLCACMHSWSKVQPTQLALLYWYTEKYTIPERRPGPHQEERFSPSHRQKDQKTCVSNLSSLLQYLRSF